MLIHGIYKLTFYKLVTLPDLLIIVDYAVGHTGSVHDSTAFWNTCIFKEHQNILALSRLTTLGQAAGNDEGFEVKVIDKEQEVGDGESEEAKGEELEGNEL